MRRRLTVSTAIAASALAVAAVVAAIGCSSSGVAQAVSGATAATPDCSVVGMNTFVRDTLRDIYFWYQQLPNADPAAYSSPEAYLEAVRYKTLDSTFSFILPRTTSDQLFNEGQYVGVGVAYQVVSTTQARVTEAYAGSPAGDVGMERGNSILAVNGRPIDSLISTGDINTIFGAAQVGVVVQMSFRDNAGAQHDVQMTKRLVTLPNVYLTQTFASGGRTVGYVAFHDFFSFSSGQLDTAFATLQQAGANDLVLDLRYNGGGLITVAQHLGGLIGGARTNGQPLVRLVFNDKHQEMNQTYAMPNPAQALGLERLVVIGTSGTASASELIINGLRPFLPVTVVGSTTHGKPVGQLSYNFCDRVLYPVAFKSVNAQGVGDYYSGIPADCAAPDDLDHQLGDGAEGSLSAALSFLRNGSCSSSAAAQARADSALRPAGARPTRDGVSFPSTIVR
jgi:carboxyl-terminal processing protease